MVVFHLMDVSPFEFKYTLSITSSFRMHTYCTAVKINGTTDDLIPPFYDTHRFAEIFALPPAIAARKRGRLEIGENVIPWTHAFIAASARAAYFYNPANNFDIALNLGCYVAICCTAYTGLIAVGVATGRQRDYLVMYMWIGVTFAIAIQWFGSSDIAGYYFVGVNIVSRVTLLSKIPHALRTRDGRYVAYAHMLVLKVLVFIFVLAVLFSIFFGFFFRNL